ncbi:MAG: hypothetical protein AVDCRST_MAG56-3471 [uncultured Cytophagales bacterium]|uniref:Uncharacterized protein n=1 Tax=uncultured Cytophagales bacterium TaxID=158755 RepID=A0A6J4JE77_9SPHI|nr:MAG: hypothetical protein AVDCRST_MAG56-3471 [uncultured Cytophagales bacterium]
MKKYFWCVFNLSVPTLLKFLAVFVFTIYAILAGKAYDSYVQTRSLHYLYVIILLVLVGYLSQRVIKKLRNSS